MQDVHKLTTYHLYNCSFAKHRESDDTLREQKGNDYNLRVNLHKQESSSVNNANDKVPELDREDIDNANDKMPELPDREYLEDIDFVSKEFDLFFKRQPDLPMRMTDVEKIEESKQRMKQLVLADEQQDVTDGNTTIESSHYMSLKKSQAESEYQSLKPREQRKTYMNVDIDTKKGSEESHYQPLTLTKQSGTCPANNEYQSLQITSTF